MVPLRLALIGLMAVTPAVAFAASDYIAPGTPQSVGQAGSIVGPKPGEIEPAPRGAMGTLGLPTGPKAPDAIAAVQPESKSPTGPVAGSNSFSAAEARRRIEASGFAQVTGLTKDQKGVWHGKALKNGATVRVYCDYQGNVGKS